MSYVGTVDVKRELNIGTATTTDDDLLAGYITQAESWVEAVTLRSFGTATATRYYREPAVVGAKLFLDRDLVSVTQLVNGNQGTIGTADYWLMPRNEGPPYHWIELKSDQVWTFDTDGEVSVTGTWGYSSSVNESIKRGVIRLVAWMYRSRPKSEGGAQTVLFTADGQAVVPSSLPKEVGSFVIPFRRPSRIIGG